jgi:hypothetical protein
VEGGAITMEWSAVHCCQVIHQKVLIKAKGIKAKGIKAFCKPKGIKGPKVLKVFPK